MYFSLVECPEIKILHYDVQPKYTDNNIEVCITLMQPKPFVLLLLVGVMIHSLIFFNQVPTSLSTTTITTTATAAELTDIELKDKDIKQGFGTSETKPTNENNIVKQEEEEKQESNGYTRARGLEELNITIDNIHLSDVIPFELPFANSLPFP
jgi:hypothetical protein